MTNQAAAAAGGRMEQQVPPPFYVDPSDLARAGYDSDGVEVEQQQPNPATATAAAAMLRGGGELHQSSSQHQPSSSHEPHFHGETSQQAAAGGGGGGGEEGAFSSSSSSSLSSRQQHPRTLFPFGGQLNSNTNPPPLSEQWQQEGTGRALEHPHRQQGYQHQELYQHQEQYRHLQDHHHHLSTHHHHEQHQQPQQQQQQPLHTSRTAALYEHHCHLLARRKAKAEELVAQQGFDFVPKLASTTKQATEARQSSRVAPGHAFERLIADADSKAKEQAKVILCLPPFAPSWPSVVSRFSGFGT
jgi:hypothetical protein